jgi:hypothetical protein
LLAVAEIIVKNDGLQFTEADWQRLIKIAEGNPNEDVVGMMNTVNYKVGADLLCQACLVLGSTAFSR